MDILDNFINDISESEFSKTCLQIKKNNVENLRIKSSRNFSKRSTKNINNKIKDLNFSSLKKNGNNLICFFNKKIF